MRGKSYDYIVVCKSPSFKIVDGISQLMLFLSLVIFVSSIQDANLSQIKIINLYVVIAIIIGWLIRSYFVQKKRGTAYYRIGMAAAGIGWLMQPGREWISAIFFVAALIEKQVKFPVEIGFDENEIVRNSFPKKYYYWNELNNVVIKDGLLTIDLKNNQLIQKEIENPGSDKADRDFNEFCRERLLAERRKSVQTAI